MYIYIYIYIYLYILLILIFKTNLGPSITSAAEDFDAEAATSAETAEQTGFSLSIS